MLFRSIKKSELSYLSDGSGRKFANNRIILNMKDNATKKDVDEIVEYVNGEIIGYLYIIGLVTIRVPENTEEGLKAMCRDIKNKYHNIVEYVDIEIFEPIKFD